MRKIYVTLLAITLITSLSSATTLEFGYGWGKHRYSYDIKTLNQTSWNDCPKGLVNDPYPGECKDYIDTDGDGICDHSEPPPWERHTNPNKTNTMERYNVFTLLALSFVVIMIGELLEDRVGKRFVRYWWNVILLFTSILSALIGFLLLFLDFKTIRDFNLVFWHVEFSIVASVLCLYHIVKRYRFFLRW